MKITYLIIATILLYSCSSDDTVDPESQLPPITTTGENTFGAIIDGKFFRPRDGRATINSDNPGLRIISTESTNVEYDVNDFKSDKTASLLIHIENFQYDNTDTYLFQSSNGLQGIDGNDNNYAHCRIWKNSDSRYNRYVSYPNSGSIRIINKIISGQKNFHNATFQLSLVNTSDINDTIVLRSGRFDLEAFSLDRKSWD